jgi:nucleotide-binding universal stress UspA family protein
LSLPEGFDKIKVIWAVLIIVSRAVPPRRNQTRGYRTMREIKTVLLPVDFSDSSELLADYALTFGTRFSARVFVLHVVSSLEDYTGLYLPHISLETVMGEVYLSAKKSLNEFCLKYFEKKIQYESILAKGDAYREILNTAAEKKVDVIIMGTHGRSGLDHLVFGSTVERVLRGAECPVLTVRVTR